MRLNVWFKILNRLDLVTKAWVGLKRIAAALRACKPMRISNAAHGIATVSKPFHEDGQSDSE